MQFHRALSRPPLPKWPRYAGASGSLKGITAEEWATTGNPIPWEVVKLCTDSDDPAGVLTSMHESCDTHDCLDLLDFDEVKQSWQHAARINAEYGN